jgi:hypothetical protein
MTEQPGGPAGAIGEDDSWKPVALREAEAQLDQTMARSRELIAQVEEKLQQLPDTDTTAKPADIAAIKAASERPDAPAEMRALKKKVDAGELSWKDVLEGKALRDETVRAAMTARLGEMREIYQEAEEGASLEEILEARGVSADDVLADSGTSYPQTAPTKPTDEDYFTGNQVVSDSAPAPADPPAPPEPPARPEPPQRSHRPARDEVSFTDDFFEDPLAEQDQPKRPEPPRGGRRKGDGRSDAPADDDYFGDSPLH